MLHMNDRPWQEYVELAKHYKAIGETSIHLFRAENPPWDLVTDFEPGGSHRMEISTDIRFTAKHHCGLDFTWLFDIEPSDANGKSGYHIDVDAIKRVMAVVPKHIAQGLTKYFASCAVAVEKRAKEYQTEADRQYGTAAALRSCS